MHNLPNLRCRASCVYDSSCLFLSFATSRHLTSFTATTSFIVYGQMNYLYVSVFGLVGFVSTVIGQLVMQALLAKYSRNSYIVYCIAFVVRISTFESVVSLVQGHTQRAGGMCPI